MAKDESDKLLPYTSESFNRQKELLHSKLRSLGLSVSKQEVAQLTFFSRRKYDRYDHFSKGETFESRLLNWLKINFEKEEMQTAFEIVRELEFVSDHELKDLAVRTFLKAEITIGSEFVVDTGGTWNTHLDVRNNRIEEELKRSLFVSLKDDIAGDYLRRYAFSRHNFQKDNFVEYYKLHSTALDELPDFERVFLLDQLCGSGTTAIRFTDDKWKGELPRFKKMWGDRIVDKTIYYCPYILSSVAQKRLSERILSYKLIENDMNLKVTPTTIIPISSCLSTENEPYEIDETKPVSRLCAKYKDKVKIDHHVREGGDPTYGYGRAGLTLIFQSNSPNNSIPLLWNSDNDWYPLFPRIKHHSG